MAFDLNTRWASRVIPLIALALLAASLVDAAPQGTPPTTTPTPTTTSSSSSSTTNVTCGFQGDDNTYGIGIRIGVYLQWITSGIAYNFVPDEAASMRGVNLVFTLSNFAGLLYITCTQGHTSPSGHLYAVEAWIVLSFCLGGVCSGQVTNTESGNTQEMTFAGYKASAVGRVIQFVLWAAMVYYTIWFLYTGMDQMMVTPCSRYAFFFTKVDLFHWFRTFLKVFFTMAAALFSLSIIVACISFMPFLTSKEGVKSLLTYANPEDKRHYPINFNVSFALVFFIISTELVIKWNHISGVRSILSTGQILPVVVGGGSLIKVLWKFMIIVCGSVEPG